MSIESPAEQASLLRRGGQFAWSLKGAALGWIGVQCTGLVAVMWLSRSLGPEVYGRLGMMFTISVYACYLNQLGIDPVLTRMLVRGDAEEKRRILAAFILQKCSIAGLLMVAGIVLALLWPQPGEKLAVLIAVFDGLVLSLTVSSAFDAQQRVGVYMLFNTLRQLAYLLGIAALSATLAEHTSIQAVLLVHLAAGCIQIVLEWRWLAAAYGRPLWNGAWPQALQLFSSVLPLSLGFIAVQALNYIGAPALEASGDAHELGYLIASNQLVIVVLSAIAIPHRIVHARLSAIDPRSPLFRKKVWFYSGILAAVGLIIACAGSLAGPFLLPLLFGAKFQSAAAIFSWDVWRAFGYISGLPLGSALICRDDIVAYSGCQVAALLVGAALVCWLVPQWGAIGAAGGIAAGRTAFAVFALAIFMHQGSRATDA